MDASSRDRIEKQLQLRAPRTRVWQALTDPAEFGAWFRVRLDGPFIPGELCLGRITYPGYEHLPFEIRVQELRPETLFSFRWHPYALEPDVDYSGEPTTLVEFRLEDSAGGTLLRLLESGFDGLPGARREEAYRMNSGGWAEQMGNIASHVGG